MNKDNTLMIDKFCQELIQNRVFFRIIDERWKKRGDVDIIVAKSHIKLFEKILSKYGFERKGVWPPQSRSYSAHTNNEHVPVGAHVGGYIGAFGGGLGRLGKIFAPKSTPQKKKYYLSPEEQAFILIYKIGSRKESTKYHSYLEKLFQGKLDWKKLESLCALTFAYPKKLVAVCKRTKKVPKNIKYNLRTRRRLFFAGKFNVGLRLIYKIFRPSPYIAFVGCNGAGKSTLTTKLIRKLQDEKLNPVMLYSGRFHFRILPLNPILKFFKPTKVERGKNHHLGTKRKHMREMRIYDSQIIRFVVPFVYYLEYILRYLFIVHPKRMKYDVVLTDRSFLDIFNTPNTNKKVSKFLFHLLPQPKHILLYNDAVTLAKRRPEFQLKHIKEQLKNYEAFNDLYVMRVKTNSLAVVDDVAKKVDEYL